MRVYTEAYRPFIMGGDCNAPVATNLEPIEGPTKLGKGISGYLFRTPKGKTFVAESSTGGIVGETFEEVRSDIKATTKSVIKAQLVEAKKRSTYAHNIHNNEFWALYSR